MASPSEANVPANTHTTRTDRFPSILSAWYDQSARISNIDLVSIFIAAMLPWSTSGVQIAAVVWLVALAPSIEWRPFWRFLWRRESIAPIALFGLAVIGTLWSDAAWDERIHAVGNVAKLLMLPLFLYHFSRTPRGIWVFVAFLASCALLMVMSWIVLYNPGLSLKEVQPNNSYMPTRGIFVKNYIDQSHCFVLCMVAVAYPALVLYRRGRSGIYWTALLVALVLGFLATTVFVNSSRTSLISLPFIVAGLAFLHLSWRACVAIMAGGIVLLMAAWLISPRVQTLVEMSRKDIEFYRTENAATSIGVRLVIWQKSLQFIADAPIFGHGTGSTRILFEKVATGVYDRVTAQVVRNPHNQTLNVAIQWGVVGVLVLYTMWWLHFLLFRGNGVAAWIGSTIVLQNVFSSLFNSHLFDFVQGWIYVLGIGVAGGMLMRDRSWPADSGARIGEGGHETSAVQP
jgi:O-antigen ligase